MTELINLYDVIPSGEGATEELVFISKMEKNLETWFPSRIEIDKEFYFKKSLSLYAKELFASFRELDKAGVEAIFVEGVEEKGLGLAIMNRLRKAASKII